MSCRNLVRCQCIDVARVMRTHPALCPITMIGGLHSLAIIDNFEINISKNNYVLVRTTLFACQITDETDQPSVSAVIKKPFCRRSTWPFKSATVSARLYTTAEKSGFLSAVDENIASRDSGTPSGRFVSADDDRDSFWNQKRPNMCFIHCQTSF